MVAPPDHAPDCHRSRGTGDWHFRGRKDYRVADCQPGLPEYAAWISSLATDAVHERKIEDGRIRKSVMDKDSGLDDRSNNHCAQRKTTAGHISSRPCAQSALWFPWAARSPMMIQSRSKHLTIQRF